MDKSDYYTGVVAGLLASGVTTYLAPRFNCDPWVIWTVVTTLASVRAGVAWVEWWSRR